MTEAEQRFHEQLVATLELNDDQRLASVLQDARAADIAESFDLIDEGNRSRILFALPPHTAAEVVTLLDDAVRGEVVEDLDTEALTEIVSNLPPDDAADVLGELTDEQADQILDQLEEEQSDQIEELLEYDEQTAGGIMTPDVAALRANATVAEAIEYIRQAKTDEDLHEIYVIDDQRRVVGTVPLRKLVTTRPGTRLGDIAEPDPVVVSVHDDQETVVQGIRKYDAMEAAVVDGKGRLVGRITHDDLLDVAAEEAEEDVLRMAGTDAAELETSSVLRAAQVRLTWLLPSMLGMLLSASVLGLSKAAFSVVLFGSLVMFVPMIGAIGGNSGIQTATVIVRGFAVGDIGSMRLMRAIAREGRIALIMAPISGLAAWILARFSLPFLERLEGADTVPDPQRVALAVGVAMSAAILVSATLGIALPFTFRRLGVDPAIASGPLVTTLNDVISVSIYMAIGLLIVH
jgi:magnesium transporter